MAQLTLGTSAAITPALVAVNGTPTAISTDVAAHFGKQHNNVLRDIENLLQELPADRLLNFEQTVVERPNPAGGAPIQSRAYRLTRDGFTLLAMGFTGKKALAFKLAYLDAFNRMETELAGRPLPALALHTSADLLNKLGAASSMGQLVQQTAFAALLKQRPLPGADLPAGVKVLLHQRAAEMAAQALPLMVGWLANKATWGYDLSSASGREIMQTNAATRLRDYTLESWLSDGRADMARSMVVLLTTLKVMATEQEAAAHAELDKLMAGLASHEYATGTSAVKEGV